jgi:hypothetical protein
MKANVFARNGGSSRSGSAAMSTPSITISPAEGRSSPPSIESSVVFP